MKWGLRKACGKLQKSAVSAGFQREAVAYALPANHSVVCGEGEPATSSGNFQAAVRLVSDFSLCFAGGL